MGYLLYVYSLKYPLSDAWVKWNFQARRNRGSGGLYTPIILNQKHVLKRRRESSLFPHPTPTTPLYYSVFPKNNSQASAMPDFGVLPAHALWHLFLCQLTNTIKSKTPSVKWKDSNPQTYPKVKTWDCALLFRVIPPF